MNPEMIARINELARLAKERALTPEELSERAELRRQYVDQFKAGARQTLENTLVQYPDGSRLPLKDAAKRPEKK
jgi:uncharacterized protein YnzC (UPF0291/DUF896 family)